MRRLGEILEALDSLARTGWMLRGVPPSVAETVSSHLFKSAVIAFEVAVRLRERGVAVDPYRAAAIALFHDIGESIIGDIPRTAGIRDAKREAELRAVETLPLSPDAKNLVAEFEAGSSTEALVAKLAEHIATLVRAAWYERLGYRVGEIEDSMARGISSLVDGRPELKEAVNEILGRLGYTRRDV